ncbi:hypothetical protein CNR22_00025 [Sphingobacteriaceae bacterium]|nr:hypothetical protein CNR22_00025 [Sphingobacteriaceae bacterium]
MNGRAVLSVIQQRFPEIKVILLSTQSNAELQSEFMGYGANSFISKDANVETLLKAIRKVHSEGFFFNSSLSKALLSTVLKEKHRATLLQEISFNEREREIIKKICDGLTNKQIAVELHLSASTIDFYRTKIYGKTNCNNVATLLRYALKNGLVELN